MLLGIWVSFHGSVYNAWFDYGGIFSIFFVSFKFLRFVLQPVGTN